MKKRNLLFYSILLFVFSGCFGKYDIAPNYNKLTKTLKFNSKEFENTKLTFNKEVELKNFYMHTQTFTINNNECKTITYNFVKAKGDSVIRTNLEGSLKTKYKLKTSKCEITRIDDVSFYSCQYNDILKEKDFFIGRSSKGAKSYSQTTRISLDKTCYNSILTHYKSLALEDKKEITNTLLFK